VFIICLEEEANEELHAMAPPFPNEVLQFSNEHPRHHISYLNNKKKKKIKKKKKKENIKKN
jgi:hypothetical protein